MTVETLMPVPPPLDRSVIPGVPEIPRNLPGEWTFWADQAKPPHEPLGPVTCTGFTCSWRLSEFGAAEATIPIEEGGLARSDLWRFYGWRLWAYYAGAPVWAGLPTDLVDEGGATVTVALTELPGYLNRKQHATTVNHTQREQTEIAGLLASRLENIGVRVERSPGASPVLRDRSYAYLEGGAEGRGGLLANLSQVIDGPEFRAEYRMEAGRPVCVLRVAYPRVGQDTGLGLAVPGGATSFRLRWGGAQYRTRTFAVGELPDDAADNARTPVEVRVAGRGQAGDPPEIPNTPAVDAVDDWPGVVVAATLRERATTNAAIYSTPVLDLEASMPAQLPQLGTYGVGDDIGVTITDTLLPGGLTLAARIIGMEANAADGSVAWTISNVLPPPKLGDSLTARLGHLDQMASGLFHKRMPAPPPGIED